MTTVETLAKQDKAYSIAQVLGDFWLSPSARTDKLFEALRVTEEQKKLVLLQVRGDESQYQAIKQIVKEAFGRLRTGGRLVACVGSPDNLCAVMNTLKQEGGDANCWMIQVSRGIPQLVDIRFESMNPIYLISVTREA